MSRFHLRRDAQRAPSLGARRSLRGRAGRRHLVAGGSDVGGRGRATVFIPRRLAASAFSSPGSSRSREKLGLRGRKEEGKGLGEGYVREVLAPGIRWGAQLRSGGREAIWTQRGSSSLGSLRVETRDGVGMRGRLRDPDSESWSSSGCARPSLDCRLDDDLEWSLHLRAASSFSLGDLLVGLLVGSWGGAVDMGP